jgi:signal transduction histidine kinase
MGPAYSWELPTKAWRIAALAMGALMLGWLAWHAIEATLTVRELEQAHREAVVAHDAMLRLEAEIQRTAQLAIATGEPGWSALHASSEQALRELMAARLEESAPGSQVLQAGLVALDELSRIESRAQALQAAGRADEAFVLVTGEGYAAGLQALGRSIADFDESYHGWVLSRALGLTRAEITSLLGALLLFALAIGAWLALARGLQREQDALRQAQAELLRAQKLELLGQLSGGIAHDFDNVLSAAAGYASMLEEAPDAPARARALHGLQRAVRQGRGLTGNLLAFMRQEQAGHEPVELGALVEETREWLAPLLPAAIELVVENRAGDGLWVSADPLQLQQAFANLALNARDAMPGGGTLRVTLCRREGGEAGPGAGFACLAFTDTGVGMDEETLQRAREPFFSTKADGTGLGLGSVERVVEAHGGRLELESAAGGGTRARILLPMIALDRAPETPGAPAGIVPVIWLSSPDAYSRQLLSDALEDAGLHVLADAGGPGEPGGGARALLLDWRRSAAELESELRRRRDAGFSGPIIVLLDPEAADAAGVAEEEGGGRTFLVSRRTALGELGEFVRRSAGVQP